MGREEEGLRAGRGPARLAHTGSLESLPRVVILTWEYSLVMATPVWGLCVEA